MKNNIFISAAILALIISIGTLYTTVSNNKKQGFVINSELFEGFKGTIELKRKLKIMADQNKELLNAISLNPTDQNLKMLYSEAISREEEIAQQYTGDIWVQLNKNVNDFAKEHNYNIILGANGSGSLMYADSTLNITSLLIEYSNKRYEGN